MNINALLMVFTVLFSTVTLASPPRFSPPSPESAKAALIYNAMDVFERDVTGGRVGAVTYRKYVGGLTCERKLLPGSHMREQYQCKLIPYPPKFDGRAIYEALNVRPVREPRPTGGYIVEIKRVANLTCQEARPVHPRYQRRYSCRLQ